MGQCRHRPQRGTGVGRLSDLTGFGVALSRGVANLALALIVCTSFVVCGWLVTSGHPVFATLVLLAGVDKARSGVD